jgi:hypothetical protein
VKIVTGRLTLVIPAVCSALLGDLAPGLGRHYLPEVKQVVQVRAERK